MRTSINSTKFIRVSDPSVRLLNYTAAWPITTNNIAANRQAGTGYYSQQALYIRGTASLKSRGLSNESQCSHSKTEQKTSETYLFQKSQKNSTSNLRTDTQRRHTIPALVDYTIGLRKHTDNHTVRITKTCHVGNHH